MTKNSNPTLAEAYKLHNVLIFNETAHRRTYEGNPGSFTVKAAGKTFKASETAYGNWYGYISGRREVWFFGSYLEQQADAFDWIQLVTQAAALKGTK
jgi:hypothetical protein